MVPRRRRRLVSRRVRRGIGQAVLMAAAVGATFALLVLLTGSMPHQIGAAIGIHC